MGDLYLRPWTVKAGKPWVKQVHRRLPNVQGAMWCIAVYSSLSREVVGCALVGHAAHVWSEQTAVLSVLRVAVLEGYPNACSMLYGACSRMAKAAGAEGLVTYLHGDEHGTSLKASGWIFGGWTSGGEHSRESRPRTAAIDSAPKQRWWAPWSKVPD